MLKDGQTRNFRFCLSLCKPSQCWTGKRFNKNHSADKNIDRTMERYMCRDTIQELHVDQKFYGKYSIKVRFLSGKIFHCDEIFFFISKYVSPVQVQSRLETITRLKFPEVTVIAAVTHSTRMCPMNCFKLYTTPNFCF